VQVGRIIDGQPGRSASSPISPAEFRSTPPSRSTIPASMPGSGLPMEPGLMSMPGGWRS
jgi:hypothetical protein